MFWHSWSVIVRRSVDTTNCPRMSCSKFERTSRIALLMLLFTACAQSGGQTARFHGADQSVDVFEFDGGITASPYDYRPATRAFTMRREIQLQREASCVYVAMLANSEVYWDG